jgi:glycerol-3-phosphate dehydrogenase
VALQDLSPGVEGHPVEVQSTAVVNAAGVWSDGLRGQVGRQPRLRRLRGGHLLFPWERVPLNQAVSFLHPQDARPLFIFPWEGVTLYGTTDVDHDQTLDEEVALSASDVQATFAGIRPVVASAKASPSRASREHVLWQEDGLLTVTGGKLTTFRLMAQPALRAVRARPAHGPFGRPDSRPRQPVLDAPTGKPDWPQELNPEPRTRLLGRYGAFSPSARTSLNSQAGAATSRRAADDTIPRFAAGEA